MPPRLATFLDGVRNELPILFGVFPFGMIYGVLALEAGIPPFEAQAMSAIVFAGSSQMILAQLFRSATPTLVMLLTIFVVNLRHALYSASLAPHIQHLSMRWKLLLSYLLTDEAYAVSIVHYQLLGAQEASSGPNSVQALGQLRSSDQDGASERFARAHWFVLGAGLALWTTWQVSTALGIFLGAVIPDTWGLDFTLALTFIALVAPSINDRPAAVAMLVAGVTSLLSYGLPYRLGLILSAICGVGVGLWVEERRL